MAPKPPMFPGKAKSVIFLFMYGGPSQVDTFDPKPDLIKFHGKGMNTALHNVGEIKTFGGDSHAPLMRSPYEFKKYGKSGIEVSDLFPQCGRVRGRYLLRAFHLRRQQQPRARAFRDEHGFHFAGLSVRRLVGHVWAWAAKIRTCPVLS